VCEGEGVVLVDPMVASSSTGFRREERWVERRRLDRELERLELEAAHREGRIEPGEAEPWERSHRWLDEHGSFAELRALLGWLPTSDREALVAVFGPDRDLRRVGPRLEARVLALVELLAGLMPAEIRVPQTAEADAKLAWWRGRTPAHRRMRAERDERLRRVAAEEGRRAAAERFGLSERHVRRLAG
jgi:hypothetical protein